MAATLINVFILFCQAVASVNTLLEKADRLYKQLQLNRPALEDLLIKITEKGLDKIQVLTSVTTITFSTVSFLPRLT